MFSSEFDGSDFLETRNDLHQSRGLARYRSAPSSFLAALLDSDNSSSGDDESDVFFSALIDDDVPRHPNWKNSTEAHGSVKQEIGGHPGYVGSYSVGMESQVHVNTNCSHLIRQSSSPVMFFNGFGVMGEANHHHMSFSSSPSSSSSRFMPTIPENVNETPGNGRLKRKPGVDPGLNGLENQNGQSKKMSKTSLVSHMSLPETCVEMAVVDNYLNFEQETNGVPCQLRAKRGFATHPRSIAERMRRTRISDKMKKLQDLFPNMDKQTKTADMLDMAVEYIKDLQNQVQTLNDVKTKCVCFNESRQTFPTT